LLDKIIPDPIAREKAKAELANQERQVDLEELRLALSADQMQADINKIEAGSADKFTSRARPFIMWVCGVAFAYHFILQPLLAFTLSALGHKVDLPAFDMDALNTVLMGLLGLGGMRSFEKYKGVAK
jgi:hypothetical protein